MSGPTESDPSAPFVPGAGDATYPQGGMPPMPPYRAQGSAPPPLPQTSAYGQEPGPAPAAFQDGYGYPQNAQTYPHPHPQQLPSKDFAADLKTAYWLTVLFGVVAALIYYLIDKDKGNPRARQLLAANLNFSILRLLAVVTLILPPVGIIVIIALIILQIVAATKVVSAYTTGTPVSPFAFNLPMVK